MTTRPTDEETRIELESGKYTIIQRKDGRIEALRYGEAWRDLTGDKLFAALIDERQAARDGVTEWTWNWLMDYCRENGASPANHNRLFKLVADMRAMLSTSPQPQQSVLDLLALIHRDGGHYTGEHGIEKSIQDAFDKIAELRAQPVKVPDERPLHTKYPAKDEPRFNPINYKEVHDSVYFWRVGWNACREAMLSAAPAYSGKKEG